MIEKESTSQNSDSCYFTESTFGQEGQPFTPLISREDLIRRLQRGTEARARFVESHLNKTLAFQIRSLRGDWTQLEFAKRLGMEYANNISARLENPNYGKHTLTTLKKIAAARDVALIVWFVPFSRVVNWASATPYEDAGLTPGFYNIPSFTDEFGLVSAPSDSVPQDRDSEKTKHKPPRGAADEGNSLHGFIPPPDGRSLGLGQAA